MKSYRRWVLPSLTWIAIAIPHRRDTTMQRHDDLLVCIKSSDRFVMISRGHVAEGSIFGENWDCKHTQQQLSRTQLRKPLASHICSRARNWPVPRGQRFYTVVYDMSPTSEIHTNAQSKVAQCTNWVIMYTVAYGVGWESTRIPLPWCIVTETT